MMFSICIRRGMRLFSSCVKPKLRRIGDMSVEGDSCPIILKPGENPKPYPPTEDVEELIEHLYGLKIKSIKELNSFDDRNYYITVEDHFNNPYIKKVWPHGYVLKILNSMDSKKPDLIDGQHAMMHHLREGGFNSIQECVVNVNGQQKSLENLAIKNKPDIVENTSNYYDSYIVRLFTFAPGDMICTVPYTEDLLYQLGKFIGKFDVCLKDFYHKGYNGPSTLWNLMYIGKLLEFVDAVEDSQRNVLIRSIVHAYQHEVEPNYSKLSKGIIHGDFNEQNILVCQSDKGHQPDDKKQYIVSSVLDFGDSSHSYYVWEVAVAIMYMMLDSKIVDPINVGGHVLAGYLSEIRLNDTEWSLLKICIASRFAQSLTLSAYTYAQNPTNKYLLSSSKYGWGILDKFWKLPKDELYSRWQEIILTYKN